MAGIWNTEGKVIFGATDTRRRGCSMPALGPEQAAEGPALIRAVILRFKHLIFRRKRLDLKLELNRVMIWRKVAR